MWISIRIASAIHPQHMTRDIRTIIEPRHKKTGLRGFRQGPTQTGLYNHRRSLEARNFVFEKESGCTTVACSLVKV